MQVGEVLKSNVIINGKDEYCCYLKDEYENIGEGIISLILYIDRNEYNSAELVNKSYNLVKGYTTGKILDYNK